MAEFFQIFDFYEAFSKVGVTNCDTVERDFSNAQNTYFSLVLCVALGHTGVCILVSYVFHNFCICFPAARGAAHLLHIMFTFISYCLHILVRRPRLGRMRAVGWRMRGPGDSKSYKKHCKYCNYVKHARTNTNITICF